MEDQKKLGHRRTIDHGNTFSRLVIDRSQNAFVSASRIRPDASYISELLPPFAYENEPMTSLATKFVHTSINKVKHPVLSIVWTPEGRRLLTGSMSGEFTLWNGLTFNFETIMQAHENSVRSLVYSSSGEWLLSGDQDGIVKYWQPNLNNINILSAHKEVIRDIAFSPNDTKFVTASDDSSLKIWNFSDAVEETTLSGHGWDVKCCDWHPSLGLIVSGSKDNLIKLWDPRSGKCLSTLHGYKNTVTKTLFQKTGGQRLLASSGRDNTGRIFDLRKMADFAVLRGHESDVSALAWHPIHSHIVSTGTHDGTICHFALDTHVNESSNGLQPVHTIPNAHDWPIWSLQYHPMGHILASGSNDKTTRFWCRSRPNDEIAFKDRYYSLEEKQQRQHQQVNQMGRRGVQPLPPVMPPAPPVVDQPISITTGVSNGIPGIPGIPGLSRS